jgi:hypothetical protein
MKVILLPVMVAPVISAGIPPLIVMVPVSVVPDTVNSNATGVVPALPPGISPVHLPAGLWANANVDMANTRVSTNRNFIFMLYLQVFKLIQIAN